MDSVCKESKKNAQYQKTKEIHTNRPLKLLYMDLMGPTQVKNLGEKIIFLDLLG